MATLESLPLARAPSSELSNDVAETFSHVASMSSTPPTTLTDSMSTTSEASKHDAVLLSDAMERTTEERDEKNATVSTIETMDAVHVAEAIEAIVDAPASTESSLTPAPPTPAPESVLTETPSTRARRNRPSEPIYNLAKLSGTAMHGKRRANGDQVADRKRRTVSGGDLTGDVEDGSRIESPSSSGRKKHAASPEPPRRATRSTGLQVGTLATKVSSLGKRSRKTFEQNLGKMSREMRRLQDTNEFAGIDTKPVLYTTWAKGKYVEPNAPEPPRKKAKRSELLKKEEKAAAESVPELPIKRLKAKKYLSHGLYSGQAAPLDINKHLTPNEKKILAEHPELVPTAKVNSVLPMPMFNGLRLLIQGRNFVMPYDVCNPLPAGQPKPATWRNMTRNRFIGDAGAMWKKSPHFKDYQSKCVCTPEDGCAESCQNRIMLYECDNNNCNAGAANCQNRAFAKLQERVKAGGKFRVGVEVIKTEDRGFGIRSNRCFEPGQIIMEYTGEIINEEECERRMEQKYKDNECYYLMSFDQNMIIDATTGSIARFVNHSCQPNCRMIKWIVSGQPRMALFAGDKPIQTGEELTYDYNFDPFSAKNVQKCLCGAPNCRGVLGPKPKEVKPPKPSKAELKKAVKKGVSAGKRKLQELLGGDDAETKGPKKRKYTKSKGIKRTISNAKTKAARGAAKVVKKSVSSISVKAPSSGRRITTIKRKSSVVKTYSKTKTAGRHSTPKKPTARKSSLTIVAASNNEIPKSKASKKSPGSAKSVKAIAAQTATTPTPRKRGRPRKHPLPSESPKNDEAEAPRVVDEVQPLQTAATEEAA